MGFLKFIAGIFCIFIGGYIFSKGFYLPNSSAADFVFGTGLMIAFVGFIFWANL